MYSPSRFRIGFALATLGAIVLSACSSDGKDTASAASSEVVVTNCGEERTYPAPVTKLFAHDGNIISIALAAGAAKELTAVSGVQRDGDVLRAKYGDEVIDGFTVVSEKSPSLENVVAADPEVMFAGWGYGFSESKALTPKKLQTYGIDTYILSESCRSGDGATRGTMDPWDALRADITNVAKLTGHSEEANEVIGDIDKRRIALSEAPQADKRPVTFLFDSARPDIFSSGSFGAPQAILDAAGTTNALSDLADTWTKVSWERLTAANPEVIAFVDYPPQKYSEKIELLRSNPASRDLAAVKEGRFINLPYALWTSGPLNIDAAEIIRLALEQWKLVPASGITAGLDLSTIDLPGNEWQK